MAATKVNLSTASLYYGTWAEIANIVDAVVGDVAFTTDTTTHYELTYTATGWTYTRTTEDGSAHVYVSNSLITHQAAGSDSSNLPDPTSLADFTIGVNLSGQPAGNVYHVINGLWQDTGATVANLYGG